MKIERVSYKKSHGRVVRMYKSVLEKIDDTYYLVKNYSWSDSVDNWIPYRDTAFFDGKIVSDVGTVKTRFNNDVDKYFEVLIEYGKFVLVED